MGEPTHTLFRLACRTCGQNGALHITTNRAGGWSFVTVGFVGLAVNRHNPPNSVLRCNSCSSSVVQVYPWETNAPPASGAGR